MTSAAPGTSRRSRETEAEAVAFVLAATGLKTGSTRGCIPALRWRKLSAGAHPNKQPLEFSMQSAEDSHANTQEQAFSVSATSASVKAKTSLLISDMLRAQSLLKRRPGRSLCLRTDATAFRPMQMPDAWTGTACEPAEAEARDARGPNPAPQVARDELLSPS